MFTQHRFRLGSLAALAALALITLFSLVPVGAPVSAAAGPPRLRAVHAVPNFGAVDVYVDGVAVLRDLTFFSVSNYLPIAPGFRRVQIIPAGEDIANPSVLIADRRATYVAGRDYTSVARGLAGQASLGTTPRDDDNAAPVFGKAKLRVAHFSPSVHDVDIYIDGEKVIDRLTSNRTSPYLSVDPGTYTIGVAVSGEQPFFTTSLTIEAGQVVTVWANGLIGSPGAAAFKLTPSIDAAFAVARVRAVHAIPDIAGSPVDVYVDDAKVVTFDFFDVTDYLPLYAGDYTVRVTLAGDDPDTDAVITAAVTVAGGQDYSIIARGTGGAFGASVLVDNNQQPAIGQARVRAAHFSPDAPAVDVYVNGTKQIDALSFQSASGYLSVPPGDYTLGIAPAGGSIIFTDTATLEAGQVVTVWANGLLAGSGAQAFKLTPSIDAAFAQAEVRLLHAVPDAPAVDIFLDGERVAAGITFGTISGYLPVTAGSYNVEIKPAGGSTVVFSGSLTLEAGKRYTAAAIGLLSGTPSINVVRFEDSPAPAGAQANLRIIQLAPGGPAMDVLVEDGQVANLLRLASSTQSVWQLADRLSYAASGSIELQAGTYALSVLADEGGVELLRSRPVLAAGSSTTIFVIGKASADAPAEQQMRLISTGETTAEAPQQTTRVYLPIVLR